MSGIGYRKNSISSKKKREGNQSLETGSTGRVKAGGFPGARRGVKVSKKEERTGLGQVAGWVRPPGIKEVGNCEKKKMRIHGVTLTEETEGATKKKVTFLGKKYEKAEKGRERSKGCTCL